MSPPVAVGAGADAGSTCVIWGIAYAGFGYRETGFSVTKELVVNTSVVG